MASRSGDSASNIGSILVQERTRQGLDLGVLEERTKIRAKYLRALENEEWDVLPGPAYVRGWLRTYAGELGLDADELVDAYRSAYEEPDTRLGVADPLLGGRTARDRPRVDRRIIVIGLIIAVAVLLGVLGLTSGSDEPAAPQRAAKRHGAVKHGHHKQHRQPVPDTVELKLSARSDSEVCLVNKGGAILIDDQVLSGGDEESFEADAFTLSLVVGELKLAINGDDQTIAASEGEPQTWEIVPRGLQEPSADANQEKCP